MDFQSLSRRALQALCKNNKIPANMTNVAMADALAALDHVEGLEELGKDLCETPVVRRTAPRTTTRRKPTMELESDGSIQSTRTRVMTKVVAEKTDEEEENMNINSLQTPAAPTTQRRLPAASARTKLASEKADKKKAPAAASVQSAYSTRRSTRLLEKTMAELTLTAKRIVEPNAIDEEAPTVVNMTEKEALKPIKMEELHAEEDMPKGVSDVDEENKDIEGDEKSSVIPETESKKAVVDVSDLKEATKEETLDIAATNGDAVDDNAVEGVERDLRIGEELLMEIDESSKPSLNVLVEVGSEKGEKSLPDDAQEVEEVVDLEVVDDQVIFSPEWSNVAGENANEEDEVAHIPIGFTSVTSVSTPPPVSSVKKMKEKDSGKEELLLQVYADPESVPANNTPPSVQKTCPYSAATLKSSSKINQSSLVNENNENNNIIESGKKVVEPLASAVAGDANAVEVVIQKKIAAKSLENMSLRELTKMLKEKLVINNKKEDTDEAPLANLPPKKQQQVEQMMGNKVMIRQALQTLPENLQAIGEAE